MEEDHRIVMGDGVTQNTVTKCLILNGGQYLIFQLNQPLVYLNFPYFLLYVFMLCLNQIHDKRSTTRNWTNMYTKTQDPILPHNQSQDVYCLNYPLCIHLYQLVIQLLGLIYRPVYRHVQIQIQISINKIFNQVHQYLRLLKVLCVSRLTSGSFLLPYLSLGSVSFSSRL